jgi:hypothetical protein
MQADMKVRCAIDPTGGIAVQLAIGGTNDLTELGDGLLNPQTPQKVFMTVGLTRSWGLSVRLKGADYQWGKDPL